LTGTLNLTFTHCPSVTLLVIHPKWFNISKSVVHHTNRHLPGICVKLTGTVFSIYVDKKWYEHSQGHA